MPFVVCSSCSSPLTQNHWSVNGVPSLRRPLPSRDFPIHSGGIPSLPGIIISVRRLRPDRHSRLLGVSSWVRSGRHCAKPDTSVNCLFDLRCGMADKSRRGGRSVYLYIPNIIGYIRILANCIAFGYCVPYKWVFTGLYIVSFVCDELDGRFARMLNQVSTFGAVLDMVTDRVSTACLLVLLSRFYSSCFNLFVGLLALDIASHWLQMYSTFLSSKTSHKDVKDSTSWLLRTYYGQRLFMGYCCVGSEVLYVILFLLARGQSMNLIEVIVDAVRHKTWFTFPLLLALPGWTIKQIVNVIQLKTAADVCVDYDMRKRERP